MWIKTILIQKEAPIGARKLCVACGFFVLILFLLLTINPYWQYNDTTFEDVTLWGTVSKIRYRNEKLQIYIKGILISEVQNSIQNTLSDIEKLNSDVGAVCYLKEDCLRPKIGSVILVQGTWHSFEKPRNPGQFDMSLYNQINGYGYQITNAKILKYCDKYDPVGEGLYCIRQAVEGVYDDFFSPVYSGILKAMILGDKDYLDEDVKNLFELCGCSHLLVISGTHIGIIGLCIFRFLRKIMNSWKFSAGISIILIILYSIMTGQGASSVRAVIMFSICIMAYALGKAYDMATALAFAAILTLVFNPLLIYDGGYLLSFGAVMGIAIGMPAISQIFVIKRKEMWKKKRSGKSYGNKFLMAVAQSLKMSISITIFTLPIVLYFYYRISVYSILLNLLLLPAAGVLIICSMLCGLLGLMGLNSLCMVLSFICTFILKFYVGACKFVAGLPGNSLIAGRPAVYKTVIYYMVLCLVILAIYKGKKYMCVLLLAAIIFLVGNRSKDFNLIMLDVGQGDGILMYDHRGAVLMDGGSSDTSHTGTYRIKPAVLSEGINRLDYIFISHLDEDHVNGIYELLQIDEMSGKSYLCSEGIKIQNLVMSEKSANSNKGKEITALCKVSGINVKIAKAGEVFKAGNMRFRCLFPEGNVPEDINEASMVMEFNYGKLNGLLTGDMEGMGESRITELLKQRQKKYTIYKVAHHGSKNSSMEELLEIIKPQISIISCGRDNPYGHPHFETIQRLNKVKSNIYVTAECGAIRIVCDEKKYWIKTYK